MLLCSQCTTRIHRGSHSWRIPAVIPHTQPSHAPGLQCPAHLRRAPAPRGSAHPVGHPLPAHLPHSLMLSLPRAPGAHLGLPMLPLRTLPWLPVRIPHSRSCSAPYRSRRPGAGQAPHRAHLAARSAALRSAPPLRSARGPPAAGGGGAAPARPPRICSRAPIPDAPDVLRGSPGGGTRGQGVEPTLSTGVRPQETRGRCRSAAAGACRCHAAHPFAPRFAKL